MQTTNDVSLSKIIVSRATSKRIKFMFVVLSCISIGSLFGAFANPLQKIEVWRQTEVGQFSQSYTKSFIISESDLQQPYGLDKSRAEKIMAIYNDARLQKLLLVATCILAGGMALYIGDEIIPKLEIEEEIQKIDATGKKEFLLSQIKQKWAMASKAQQLQFREELKELAALFGEDTLEADEINQTDKFINASYMLGDGHDIDFVVTQTWNVEKDSEQFLILKEKFQKWLEEDNA